MSEPCEAVPIDSTIHIVLLCFFLLFAGVIALSLFARKCSKKNLQPASYEGKTSKLEKYCKKHNLTFNQIIKKLSVGPRIKLENIAIESNELGAGHFGTVYRAKLDRPTHLKNETPLHIHVAVKIPKPSCDPQEFENELKLMANISPHPNIVTLIGWFDDNREYGKKTFTRTKSIVLELCEGGSLSAYLHKNRDNFENSFSSSTSQRRKSLNDLLSFAWQTARGMEHLARLPCVHRDLAARNIVISNDGLVVKISDFGMARTPKDDKTYLTVDVTQELPYRWMSPEAIEERKYSVESDVWSFGIVMFEIFSLGERPFVMLKQMLVSEFAKSLRDNTNKLPRPCYATDEIDEVIRQCHAITPSRRPKFENIELALRALFMGMAAKYYNVIKCRLKEENEMASTFRDWAELPEPGAESIQTSIKKAGHNDSSFKHEEENLIAI